MLILDISEPAFTRVGRSVSDHLAAVETLYRDSVIPTARLLGLTDNDQERSDAARAACLKLGGFLRPESWVHEVFAGDNICAVCYDESGLAGYFTIVQERSQVRALCTEYFGRSPESAGVALPSHSMVGGLTWYEPALARTFFDRLHRAALTGEVAVRDRRRGTARRLRVAAYGALHPGTLTLSRVFELEAINGKALVPPVVNVAMTSIMAAQNGTKIGALKERINRSAGLAVDMRWGLWLLKAEDVLRHREPNRQRVC